MFVVAVTELSKHTCSKNDIQQNSFSPAVLVNFCPLNVAEISIFDLHAIGAKILQYLSKNSQC